MLINNVVFPSSIFHLEKHEIFPFERFAYDAMKIAADALADANLPEQITVFFDESDNVFEYPWLLNAGIMPNNDGTGFRIVTTSLTPVIVMGISHFLGLYLFDSVNEVNEMGFRDRVLEFGKHLQALINIQKDKGLNEAIRIFFKRIGLSIHNISDSAEIFNLTTQFMVNHEIAHAYVGQIISHRQYTPAEDRAFEFLVDIIATEWLYIKMVRNTPDNDEYREMRGSKDHGDSIVQNSLSTIDIQINTLMVFAFASVLATGGTFSFKGGETHPHTLARHGLQMMHFTTLVLSNYGKYFLYPDGREFDERWSFYMDLFIKSGLIDPDDVERVANGKEFTDLLVAADLIKTHRIDHLKRVIPFLKQLARGAGPTGPSRDAQ